MKRPGVGVLSVLSVLSVVSVLLAACDVVVPAPTPDAGGPSIEAIWEPPACAGDPRMRIEIRLVDSAGVEQLADGPCAACSLAVPVAHVGWYQASALAVGADGGGRALATTTLAIDAPGVRWRVAW